MFSWKIICVNCGSEAAPRPERAGYPTRSFQKSVRLHSRDGSRAQGAIPHELMAMTGALHSRGVRKRSWRTRRCEAQRMNLDCPIVITHGTIRAKTGIVEFAKGLIEAGFEIISTGGTKKTLQDNGVDVIGISDVTGFPEILDGRVKTLHPNVHGAVLAKHDDRVTRHSLQNIILSLFNLSV